MYLRVDSSNYRNYYDKETSIMAVALITHQIIELGRVTPKKEYLDFKYHTPG